MHKDVLTRKQAELLPLLKLFSKNFGLVGGTAIALYIGHRRSIDFDLFTNEEFKNNEFNEKLFRSQLAYFKDIDYQEKIIYLKGYETNDKTIKKELIDFSLS